MKNHDENFYSFSIRSAKILTLFIFTMLIFNGLFAGDRLNIKPDENHSESTFEHVPDEIIIQVETAVADQLKNAMLTGATFTSVAEIDALNSRYNVNNIERVFKSIDSPRTNMELAEKYGLTRTYLLKVPVGTDIGEAIEAYNALDVVVYAEPNYIDHADLVPDDPTYPSQWGLNNTGQANPSGGGGPVGTPGADINAEAAWDLHTGDASIILAILDSGVDYLHPEFAGRIVPGTDTGDGDNDPMDSNGHGTSCAGIAAGAGNNGIGFAGVNWNCLIMPIKIGAGNSSSYTHAAGAAGMVWAADNGADVLSCSYGGSDSNTKQNGVDYADDQGCVILASRGNDDVTTAKYPASYSNVVAIGALSPCNTRKTPTSCDGEDWWGSSYGNDLDVMAPGARIHTTDIQGAGGYNGGDYTSTFNGTSAACPFAAGVAALIRSYVPSLTNDQVHQTLQQSAVDIDVPGYDNETGYGRLNAFAALNYAAGLVNDPPVALCQNVIVSANGLCEADVSPGQVDNGSSDPDGDPIELSLSPSGPYQLGDTEVTLTVSDQYFSSTCTASITVVDDSDPSIACPADITVNNDPGQCSAVVNFVVNAFDNCDDNVSIVSVPPSGSVFPVGTTTVNSTATDDAGNDAVCSFDVTVVDNEAPVMLCPLEITQENDPGLCSAVVYFEITATDNCDGDIPVVVDIPSGSIFPVGVTTVTATATDNAGNGSECSFDVTVLDTEAPVIEVIADPLSLWPPNHKYAAFNPHDFVLSVSDNCTDLTIDDIVISSVTSDEPDNANGNGDGNTINDIIIEDGCKSVQLRKERAGKGNGRVYTVYFEVTDEYDNVGMASSKVHVPHNKGKMAIDDGMAYEVVGNCGNKSLLIPENDLTHSDESTLQAYPNPFTGVTKISFATAQTNYTLVKVYNALGKEIATIYDGVAEAGFKYSVDFNAEHLTEGVYFYNMQIGNDVNIMKKLILIK